jgi:hypothetical protein
MNIPQEDWRVVKEMQRFCKKEGNRHADGTGRLSSIRMTPAP